MTESTELVITLKEVYEQQQKQGVVQAEISSKLDRLLDKHDVIDERVADHEIRVRLLEKRVWGLPSIATILAIASLIWQMVK